ncbi:hypothetical protein SAMN04487884_1483 [Butyrivibrio fibrisolvens]|uniref:Glycosyltransferase RgtA/B/C/D-like domain-containing protein n=1 Tax=Butyrivibrio fibrisolvens TaxID=831 RepID=A0A1H9X7X7_BUTFI|nr:hypothetical protein [Butyrivibrio fibrisolvens]SES42308.1 hypothetical protein SAMN04487884_1483 [Butyrivibrio fibrisolvens]
MLRMLSVLMFIIPSLVSFVIHNYLSYGKIELKKKITYWGVYIVLINLCTFFVSYIRGVKGFRFEDMTVSYRLKYMALGCLFAIVVPFLVNYLTNKAKKINMPNQFVDNIHWYIMVNAILLFIACRGIYISFFMNSVNRSLWLDEAFLASSFSQRSFLGIFLDGEFEYLQSAPLIWLWFEKGLSIVFGNTPYVLRIGSVISFIVVIIALSFVQLYFFHSKFPFAAAAIISNTPIILKYSNMFKPYMADCLVTLIAVISWGLYKKERISDKWLAIIWMGLLWCSQPVCFMIGGICLSEFIFSCIHINKKDILRIIIIGIFVGISFTIYYFVWISRMTSISDMQDCWSSYFFPFIPGSLAEVRIGIDLLLNQVFKNFDTSYYFVLALSIGGIFYSFKKKDSLFSGLYLGLLIALFASCLHMYPIQSRLWCFSYPVLALVSFSTLEAVAQNKTVFEGVIALIMLVMVIGNTGYKNYSDISNVYISGEELGLELDYLVTHMKTDDMVYVFSYSRPAFEYINGYGNINFGGGINNVFFGAPIVGDKCEFDLDYEVEKIISHPKIWIVSSNRGPAYFSDLAQAVNENGYLELIDYQYNSPLWYYCNSLNEVKKHFTMTISKNVVIDNVWNESIIHIENDGEAYLNNPYEDIYLIERRSGKVYPIKELIAPGDGIDIVVRYHNNEEPEYILCGQYGKIANDDTIKITEEMIATF